MEGRTESAEQVSPEEQDIVRWADARFAPHQGLLLIVLPSTYSQTSSGGENTGEGGSRSERARGWVVGCGLALPGECVVLYGLHGCGEGLGGVSG
jgi:hypothetical protein